MRDETESVRRRPPSSLTRFVGRESEIAATVQALRDNRLVTLVGAPGAGKTRLAAEVARVATSSFRDGVRSVELAAIAGTDDLAGAIAVALGVRSHGESLLEDSLDDALRTAEVLVLLDNCEHVIHRSAELVARILAGAPGVRVLTTSRVPLGIPGERLRRVAPLSGPVAAELFIDRADLVTDLVLDEVGHGYVDQICLRLDGLPLAIELAARQTRALSLRELLARLDSELSRMEVPGPPAPAHRTMTATIAWSCRLLSAEQNRLFERIAVFAGDFEVSAVEAVAGPYPQLLADLTVLVDHSLVLADPSGGGTLRYRMLEPIRQHAAALLDGRGDGGLVRRRHADHYLAVARRAARGLTGDEGHLWYDELRRTEQNVLSAVSWARDLRADLALQLVTCLASYWEHRGYINETRDRIEGLIDHGAPAPRARAEALLALCHLGYQQGRYAESVPRAEELVDLMRRLGDNDGLARGLRALALVAGAAGDSALAVTAGEQSVEIFRALDDRPAMAWSYVVLGFVHFVDGDIDQGANADTAALQVLETVGEAPAVSRRAHIGLAFAAARRRDTPTHRRHLEAAIADLRLIGALDGDIEWMWSGVSLAHDEGRMESTLRLAGAARALGLLGSTPPPAAAAVCREAIDDADARVGPQAAQRLLAAGATMTIEEAVAEAVGRPTTHGTPLSARELEVARLTGQGSTNAEIAEQLFISRRTVESHQDHIREKLHLSSRYEVIAWVLAERSV